MCINLTHAPFLLQDGGGRGDIFFYCLEVIQKKLPAAFVLENVPGLVYRANGWVSWVIRKELEKIGRYNIYSRLVDTAEHGIPQSRLRYYIIGILQEYDQGTFSWPEAIPRPSIELFLNDQPDPIKAFFQEPPISQGTAWTNVLYVSWHLKHQREEDPEHDAWIVDCDSTNPCYMKDVSLCLTASRAAGHWITNRGRRMQSSEMLKLQGVCPADFKHVTTDRELRVMLGNTMSVNVVERILVRVLWAAQLVSEPLPDHWESGLGLKRVLAPRAVATPSRKRALSD